MWAKHSLAVLKTSSTLLCIRMTVASRLREVIFLLLSALVKHVWNHGFNFELPRTREIWTNVSPLRELRTWNTWRQERMREPFRRRKRCNWYKLKYRKFQLNQRSNTLILRVITHWETLYWGAVESPNFSVFKTWLDTALSKLLLLI